MKSDLDSPTAWRAALLLAVANSLAFVDRQVLAILVDPIKADLGVSDTHMGLLYGFTFSLFYVALGLPMARLADRGNRRNIIAWSILTWSAMTMLCGLARTYWILLLARIGVGAGEAGLNPAAQSMLADLFSSARLPLALSLYAMGIYLGGGFALLVGGYLIDALTQDAPGWPILGALSPWQATFVIVGAPGLLLGSLVFFLREPLRAQQSASPITPLGEVWRHLLQHRGSYGGIAMGLSCMVLVAQAGGAWIPSLLGRAFAMTAAEIGLAYGVSVIAFGAAGALSGGVLARALHARGYKRANLWSVMTGLIALVPLTIAFPFAPNPSSAIALICGLNFFSALPFGSAYAAVQDITPNRMRAQAAALLLLFVNLIGVGLGPLLVGLITDFIFRDPRALGAALALIAGIFSPAAVLCFSLALGSYRPLAQSPQYR